MTTAVPAASAPASAPDRAGVDLGPDGAAIACRGLTKDFGDGHGLFDLDLTVRRGETFGYIGPNGAGKTTTIRLLMDLARPDQGTATVLGLDSRADSIDVKRRVGYLPGELMRFPRVTAGYVIGMLAGLRGGVDQGRIDALAERLQIDLSRKYETLSHGNKQKVGLVQAFMHQPDLLILDEPTLGLDPLIQREFRAMVREAVARGATVFLSSHVLSEVEQVCDRIGLVRDGRLQRAGSLDELRAMRVHKVEVQVAEPVGADRFADIPGVEDLTVTDRLVRCAVRGSIAPFLAALADVEVVELDSHEQSLEEVFFGAFDEGTDGDAGR